MKSASRPDQPSLLTAAMSPYVTAARTVTASPATRNLALVTGINAIGNGLFASINILYYTQHLGFSVSFVSAVLFGATVLAISGDLISGRVSDASSPKKVFVSGLILSAAATLLLLIAETSLLFIVTLCLIALGQGLCMSSNTALIRRIAREDPALTRASLRSLLTIGTSLGALGAGVVLANGAPAAFTIRILINAMSFVIAAALLTRVSVPLANGPSGSRPRPTIRDTRFTTFAVSNGIINIYLHALPFALPLWMVRNHPDLVWVVGVFVAANSLLCAMFQVPASSGITSRISASRRLVLGAVLVAASYVFFASGWSTSTTLLVVALLLLLILQTAGELFYTAGTMELLFRLAPEAQQGQYGAFYGISNGLLASLAPAVLGFAIGTAHGWGWWALAGVTVLLALLIRAAVSTESTPPAGEFR
ncbi:MFS transporter [Brachybacterium alimentarium]|uniref:MFS transporter n=2 Tax=Brachybacterium alimentarium TaxID=47845 RepID=UPI000BB6BED7|nr:MFS transporter [Brachybacterium alimentarium]PCC35993.1 hypothetical protein CIK71_01290 [Brachybacterium alimentarium]